jgi:hypothetical protein
MRIQLAYKDKTFQEIEHMPQAMEIVNYLNEKYVWDEFFLSSDFYGYIKAGNDLIKIRSRKLINVFYLLDSSYGHWDKLSISKSIPRKIDYKECKPGMVVKPSGNSASKYSYILDVKRDSEDNFEVRLNEEGFIWKWSSSQKKDSTLYLMYNEMDKKKFDELFPEREYRKIR